MRIQRLSFAGNFGEARFVGESAFEMRIDVVSAFVSAMYWEEAIWPCYSLERISPHEKDIAKVKKLDQEYE